MTERVVVPCITRKPGCVYFVGAGPFVKIGWTGGKVHDRIASMRTGCPYELVLLGFRSGSIEVEKDFHRLFAEHRHRGEWFHLTPEICAYIKAKCIGRSGTRYQNPHHSLLLAPQPIETAGVL